MIQKIIITLSANYLFKKFKSLSVFLEKSH